MRQLLQFWPIQRGDGFLNDDSILKGWWWRLLGHAWRKLTVNQGPADTDFLKEGIGAMDRIGVNSGDDIGHRMIDTIVVIEEPHRLAHAGSKQGAPERVKLALAGCNLRGGGVQMPARHGKEPSVAVHLNRAFPASFRGQYALDNNMQAGSARRNFGIALEAVDMALCPGFNHAGHWVNTVIQIDADIGVQLGKDIADAAAPVRCRVRGFPFLQGQRQGIQTPLELM